MKKLVLFFAAVLITAIAADLFAQGTGTAPTLGSIHEYSINGGTAVSGNSYTWSVYKGNLSTSAGTDVTIGDATAGPSVDLTWNSTATPGVNYYVKIVEETADGCQNAKVLLVVPTNPFYLAISTAQTSPVCYANDVDVSLSSDEPQYDHGTVDLVYTVTPNNIGTGTGYQFDITELLSNTTNFTTSLALSSGSISGSTVTVSNTSAVTLTFTVTNDVSFTNTTDAAGSAANIDLNVAITGGKTNQDVVDNGTGTKNVTVEAARPTTSGITTDL